MGTNVTSRPVERIKAQTARLYEQFIHNGDKERADKAALFLRKLYEEEFIVAFCGHFSAGKSTMINELTGEALLPSSPIPTSANVVKIRPADSDFAKIYYHEGPPLLFEAPYDMNHVKQFAKNGDEVSSIEIGHAQSQLPKEVTVMDTPGVDSTDDAHRISTESALHLADMVFYVMDYNHVQSELNFIYTKELLSHGAKLYLIINQVDKHKDEELSFDAFRQSVEESFAAWQVKPEAFYFTSLRQKNLPYNDFDDVQSLIQSSIQNREALSEQSAQTMIRILVHEHEKWLNEQKEAELDELAAVVAEAGAQSIEDKEASLRRELEKRDAAKWVAAYEERRDDVFKSAMLTPASTREHARAFLEAIQPGFKVGTFFAKKKTEEERENRIHTFLTDLTKQTEQQLEWHMRQMSAKWAKESGLDDQALLSEAEELSVDVDEAAVREAVKPGAGITGDALLNYAEEVAGVIKKRMRRVSDQWKEKAAAALQEQYEVDYRAIEPDYSVWKRRLDAKQAMTAIRIQISRQHDAMTALLSSSDVTLPDSMKQLESKWEAEDGQTVLYDGIDFVKKQTQTQAEEEAEQAVAPQSAGSVEAAVMRLEKMAEKLSGIPGFARFRDGALQKAARLENKTYTIALFGAFSAGKSSFANALLGEKVLPVSPNPTTAAVNRIHPVSPEHAHRTAHVHLKPRDVMLADVNSSLGLFQKQAASLDDAYAVIPDVLAANEGEGKEKIHLAFLRAFADGYESYRDEEQDTLVVGLDLFRAYVADETKSCFVDSIDLYYDCEFTRLGITLVDTPGADSINARHTGVAFEYIKNADAILFVTYYNHAFSKADREFLIQLGRVKDAFELDKMFFIINAIDLAQDEEELADVKAYVKEQLLQYGIRFPRLHGVSSMLAVEEAMNGEWDHPASGMAAFKEPFRRFLTTDLAQMAVQSAEAEADRGVEQLKKLIAAAKDSRAQGKQKQAELQDKKEELTRLISSMTAELEKKRLSQELDELVHYVHQRVFYRFSDFFKEAFNPSVLSGQSNPSAALQKALDELLQAVGYDLAQEMRATTIRIENYAKKLIADKQQQLATKASLIEPELLFAGTEPGTMNVPDFPAAFSSLDQNDFSGALSLFKNAKSFFEKNDKQRMLEQLERQLKPLADAYLTDQKDELFRQAGRFAEEEVAQLKNSAAMDVTEQFDAWLVAFADAAHVEEWEAVLRDIS